MRRISQGLLLILGALSIRVSNNRLVDNSGKPVRLRGVNRMGTEYMCVKGYGIHDGPSDDAALDTIKGWGINTIRIPLNEDCWLNINGAASQTSGANYQNAIADFVRRITAKSMYAILDLHWAAPGNQLSDKQLEFADADHAYEFWKQVGEKFASNENVIFDLFNEPFHIDWNCWRDGCTVNGWKTIGFQPLITHLRNYANNTVMLGGLEWSNDLSQWKEYAPKDPKQNMAVSWHSYNFNACNNQLCWDNKIGSLAASYPIIAGEFGENDCAHGYIDKLLPWMDAHNVSYVGWTWNVASCADTPALISNYDGTPTNFGVGYRDYLRAHP